MSFLRKIYIFVVCCLMATACNKSSSVQLTILHTNDTHSQVDPRENDNLGGYARRMGLIAEERKTDPDLLLLDAGDFCQGTPYFNYYGGDVEVDAMNRMGYDAVTLGNHEFDNGVKALADKLRKAEFPIVCSNYKVAGSPLEELVKPYIVINKNRVKIGIIGLCINPKDLITAENFAPLEWLPPFPIADSLATELKERKHCDVVVCLSHLGTSMGRNDSLAVCDVNLARQSRNIDVIVGGHTHKKENRYVKNKDGEEILLVQAGKSGMNVGKIILTLE